MKFTERIVQSYGYPPSQNDLWLDLSDSTLKFYDGGEWKPVNGGGLVSQFQSLSEDDLHAVKVALGLEEEDEGGGDDEGDAEPGYFAFEGKSDGAQVLFCHNIDWWDDDENAPAPEVPGLTIQISSDGVNWTDKQSSVDGTVLATLNVGDVVYLRGNNDSYYGEEDGETSGYEFTDFLSATGDVYIYGNMMTLIGGDEALEEGYVPDAEHWEPPTFYITIEYDGNENVSASHIYSHPDKDVVLPVTDLSHGSYCTLFEGTSISRAPELPATILSDSCYNLMFCQCNNLTAAPELPATTLADSCYMQMFSGCENLVSAPELPATTLAYSCYNNMFSECTSLTTAPVLPATELANWCYGAMFSGCTSLNYIKALFTEWPDSSGGGATNSWVWGVSDTGTFVKSDDAEWQTEYGDNNVPTGWTVISESEEAAS